MRYHLLVLQFFIGSIAATAQNWALLNPANKYNYSNDGTDTISNQIFVTHVDTLGLDSFRYELNRIGVVCDTCPESLGGPCDGCYVRVDQPQFFGLDCIRSGSDWYFNGPDTVLIKSSATVGSSWTFNENAGIIATVDAESPIDLFGTTDTVRRILLSDNDTLLLSRSFGLTRFEQGDHRYDLLGVEGAGVGRLYPDPLAYFDYQPGDQLTYKITSIYWGYYNGIWTASGADRFWTAVITGRAETPDAISYSTSTALSYPIEPPGFSIVSLIQEPSWSMPFGLWIFTRSQVLVDHPILAAYPGQVLDTSICSLYNWPSPNPNYLAKYGITADGRTIMRSQSLGLAIEGEPTSGFDADEEVSPGVFPFAQSPLLNVWYEEGIGIRRVESKFSWMGSFDLRVELVGAVIGGDTILQPPAIDWYVGVQAKERPVFNVFPNPASDRIELSSAMPLGRIWITDLQGRQVTSLASTSYATSIDVRSLPPGSYLLLTDGYAPKQFMIVR